MSAKQKIRTRGGAPTAPSTVSVGGRKDRVQSPAQARKESRNMSVLLAEAHNRQAHAHGNLTPRQQSKVRRFVRRHPGTTLTQRTSVIMLRNTAEAT